jgi:hypothetical protein
MSCLSGRLWLVDSYEILSASTVDLGAESSSGIPAEIYFSREMGLTHIEFFRILPAAIGYKPYVVDGDRVIVQEELACLEIRLSPERKCFLGALCLPVILIEFRFRGYDAEQVKRFMDRFNLYFQRGGG